MKRLLIAALFTMSFADTQPALAPTITKNFNSTVALNGNSDATITVTNPNTFPISNVQFSDTMPAGINLITQIGDVQHACDRWRDVHDQPGTETFSSTSSVLAADGRATSS
jgi:uncharacterized repeat protein (TIGR01451 family)